MFWRYLSQDVSKYNLNETSGDAHTCSDLSGAHICGLGSLRSTEGICLHVSTMQMYSTGPKLPWGLWRAVTSGLSVATSSNKLLCRLAASLYKADIGMHPYWCLQDMLKSSWGKGRNSAGDLSFLLIIGEFGLQGTSEVPVQPDCPSRGGYKPVEIHYECLFRCSWLVLASAGRQR